MVLKGTTKRGVVLNLTREQANKLRRELECETNLLIEVDAKLRDITKDMNLADYKNYIIKLLNKGVKENGHTCKHR